MGYSNLRNGYFLMEQGCIQRSYNAFAVRVQGPLDGGAGGAAANKAAGLLKVVPASETTEGLLCIEMRIRLYHDGAMSQLLEKLANVCGAGTFVEG